MTLLRSPLRSPIRSPKFNPLVGKWGAAFTPLVLFSNGEEGFLFDFSRTDRLFKESTGQTAVAVDTDPVGLALEGSDWAGRTLAQELAGQAELVAQPLNLTVSPYSATLATLGTSTITANADGSGAFWDGLLSAAARQITLSYSGLSAGLFGIYDAIGSLPLATSSDAAGTLVCRYLPAAQANQGRTYLRLGTTGASVTITGFSVKAIAGKHGAQATSGARPWFYTPGYLRPDASDDNLLTTFIPGSSGNTVAAKITVPATLAATQVVVGASGSSTARFFVGFNTSGNLVGGVGGDSTTTVIHSHDYRGETGVLALVEDGDDWFLFWDGEQVATGAQNGAVTTTIPLRLFALNNNGTAASFAATDGHYMLARNAPSTAAEMRNLANYWNSL